jgi:hypothetical protein
MRQTLLGPGPHSIAQAFSESSYGKLTLSGQVFEPVKINIGLEELQGGTPNCAIDSWAQEARDQLKLDETRFDHVVYVFSKTAMQACGYSSKSITGSALSAGQASWMLEGCSSPDLIQHQLGHNLGMTEASASSRPLKDPTDPMGSLGVGVRNFHAIHRVQMGWIDEARVVQVTSSGIYTLSGLDESSPTHTQVIQIPMKQAPGLSYFLSYRRPEGLDQMLDSLLSKAGPQYSGLGFLARTSVHRVADDGSGASLLIGSLDDDYVFRDRKNGIEVRQVKHDANMVQLEVTLTQ